MFDVVFTDQSYRRQVNLNRFISECNVSFTMDLNSQITLKILDPGLTFTTNNYFQVRRPVLFGGQRFEIASVAIEPAGSGLDAMVTVECRLAGIQRLKRLKDQASLMAATPTDLAAKAALLAGLRLISQPTTEQYESPVQTGDPYTDPSLFNVLQQLAGQLQFVVFEAEGVLFFCSQEWLLGAVRWGRFPINYPSKPTDGLQLTLMPGFRTSDDDPMAAEFQLLLQRPNARQLRPGMTVFINGVNNFQTAYLITEVSWTEGKDTPVAVSGRTPIKFKVPDPAQKADTPGNGNGVPTGPSPAPAAPLPPGPTPNYQPIVPT